MIAQDIIAKCARDMRDKNLAYYDQGFMYQNLRDIVSEIARRSRTVIFQQFYSLVAGRTDYALPERFLEFKRVEYKRGTSDWIPLSPSAQPGEGRNNSGLKIPRFYTFGPAARKLRTFGTATGGSSTQLEDTANDFTTKSIETGDLVFNLTDDSESYVQNAGVAATTVNLSKALEGGSDNTFADLDDYEIWSYHAPLKSIRIWPWAGTADSSGAESLSVHIAVEHLDMDAAMTERGLDTDVDPCNLELEIDEEFYEAVVNKLKARMSERRKGIANNETQIYDARGESQYLSALPQVRSRIDEMISTWTGRIDTAAVLEITRNGVLYSTT